MSEEDKAKVCTIGQNNVQVHDMIDAKMEELEATGLSKEELLYDGKTVNSLNFFHVAGRITFGQRSIFPVVEEE